MFSAAVQTAEHVRSAVKFAAEHNLRLVVKNTGHDFSGRAFAPNSLQIFTHNMKNITFNEDFVPNKCTGLLSNHGPAVTVAAGVQIHELYEFCAKRNITVVAGYSQTVGVAGGYIQGGGHSILGPWKGLATDHALQFTVVVANVS